MLCDNAVDDAVLKRLLGGHEVVSVGILFDLLNGLAGVFGKDLVEHISCAEDQLCADLDVACLTLRAAKTLSSFKKSRVPF